MDSAEGRLAAWPAVLAVALLLAILFTLSPDALLLLVVPIAAARLGWRRRAALYLPTTLAVVFLALFRAADLIVPRFFFRPFNLYIDSRFFTDAVHVFYTSLSGVRFALFAAAALTTLGTVFAAAWWSLNLLHRYLECDRSRPRRWALGLLAAILLQHGAIALAGTESGPLAQGYYSRLGEEISFVLNAEGYRQDHREKLEPLRRRRAALPTSLDRLERADVYLIFVESYGETALRHPEHAESVLPALATHEKELTEAGIGCVSALLDSPTYGGSSWLAHAALTAGVRTADQLQYNVVLTSDLEPMAVFFERAGYRTVSAMPGTRWIWPEGEFFRFQKTYYAWDFDYWGRNYGWVTMADQYVLDQIARREMQTASQPLFAQIVLITSHAPFHEQPTYVTDWESLGNGKLYWERETLYFPLDLSRIHEAYATAIRYELRVIFDFVRLLLPESSLVLVLGDHQPAAQVTDHDPSRAVPIHVLSHRSALLEPFRQRGYDDGLLPYPSSHQGGMEDFLHHFLEDFSSPSPSPAPVAVAAP